MGVTPLLASLDWGKGVTVTAVDSSKAMIDALWPGDVPGRRRAVRGDWRDVRSLGYVYDAAIGDGVFNLMGFPDGLRALLRALSEVLRDGGVLVTRAFTRPAIRERPVDVLTQMYQGQIEEFSMFELRLLMAAQSGVQDGMTLSAAAAMWHDVIRAAGATSLTGEARWETQATETLQRWNESTFAMTFPTLEEIRNVVCEEFVEMSVAYPSYPLGERCPTVSWRLRRKA